MRVVAATKRDPETEVSAKLRISEPALYKKLQEYGLGKRV